MNPKSPNVFLSLGKHGGIQPNQERPAEFMFDNLRKQLNLIHAAYKYNVTKLLFLASSCIYPKDCHQPMRVEDLMSGVLEHSSEFYALAKLAGLKLCQAYRKQYGAIFICAIPADVYGPGDDFDSASSHVSASLIRKMHEAKEGNRAQVRVWGSGLQRREFLYVDDVADACIFLMNTYDSEVPINIGHGIDISIKELAGLIADVVHYQGLIHFDTLKPEGMPRKLLDSLTIRQLGWASQTTLHTGLQNSYEWYTKYFLKIH